MPVKSLFGRIFCPFEAKQDIKTDDRNRRATQIEEAGDRTRQARGPPQAR
jgi:hypothetical protein